MFPFYAFLSPESYPTYTVTNHPTVGKGQAGRARRGERAGEEGRGHRNLCWAVRMSGCRCGPARWHVSAVPREGMGHCNLPNKLGKGSREKRSFLRLVHAPGAATFASGTFSDARGRQSSQERKRFPVVTPPNTPTVLLWPPAGSFPLCHIFLNGCHQSTGGIVH